MWILISWLLRSQLIWMYTVFKTWFIQVCLDQLKHLPALIIPFYDSIKNVQRLEKVDQCSHWAPRLCLVQSNQTLFWQFMKHGPFSKIHWIILLYQSSIKGINQQIWVDYLNLLMDYVGIKSFNNSLLVPPHANQSMWQVKILETQSTWMVPVSYRATLVMPTTSVTVQNLFFVHLAWSRNAFSHRSICLPILWTPIWILQCPSSIHLKELHNALIKFLTFPSLQKSQVPDKIFIIFNFTFICCWDSLERQF